MLIQESRQDVGVVCDPLSFGDIRRGQKEDACGQSKARQSKAKQDKARQGKAKQSTININTNIRHIR
ncbi:unnamed protein product [Diplocarpon coronariae]